MQPAIDSLNKVELLVGKSLELDRSPLVPYSDLVCDFLHALSTRIQHHPTTREFPELATFAFWCRKGNIQQLKHAFEQEQRSVRLGVGLVFTIAPSNVPINFAYSLVYSMLAGNANIVRVPTKAFPQVRIICECINSVLEDDAFSTLRSMMAVIRYERDDEITATLSASCNGRIIWGGDDTVSAVRSLPIPARAREVAFADRYSLCAIQAEALMAHSQQLEKIVADFYNDTYLMDQRACSSPHLVAWIGPEDLVRKASQLFWQTVAKAAANKYDLEPIKAVDKFTQLCTDAIDLPNPGKVRRYGNMLNVVSLEELPANLDNLRGSFGYFYDCRLENLEPLASAIHETFQTLTYFGFSKEALADFVTRNRLRGLDRIVPIGQALAISSVWDGVDLIRTLSRICDIR